MDEQELIDRLGTVGLDGPPVRHPLDAPLLAGQRARRRRRLAGLAASGTAFATVAAVALVAANAGSARQFVESPGDPAAAPAVSSAAPAATRAPASAEDGKRKYLAEQRELARILQEHLGTDWELSDGGQVVLRPGSPTAQALPDGFSVYTEVRAGEWFRRDPYCGAAAPDAACERRTLADGRQVWIQRDTYPGDPKEPDIIRTVRAIYDQPDGDRVMLTVNAQEPEAGSTAVRQEGAGAWLEERVPGLAAAAVDPAVAPGSPAERNAEARAARDLENRRAAERGQATPASASAAMASALGADFALEDEQVVLRPGSPAAGRLPADYDAWAQAIAGPVGGFGDPVSDFCRALVEKGMDRAACEERTLPDGSTAYVQWSSWAPTPKDVQPNVGQGLRVVYVQPDDGDRVILDLNVGQSAGTATDATQAEARAWLEGYVDDLVAAASDPGV